MAHQHLAKYLNDHFAGATTALELLEHVARVYTGTEVATFAVDLGIEVHADRQKLEDLMKQWAVEHSWTRAAFAWLAEKGAQLKLQVDDRSGGALRLLEAMATGIEGKRSLWAALAAVADSEPALRGPDYACLEQRARDQRNRVEAVRLKAAKDALNVSGEPAVAK